MENIKSASMRTLKEKLNACHLLLNDGCAYKEINTNWLNKFCAKFFDLTNALHDYMGHNLEEHVEMISLCLTQVVVCIRYLECTFKAETANGTVIPASRQHFLDRMRWCLERLRSLHPSEEQSFLKIMDSTLDILTTFNSDINETEGEEKDLLSISKQIRGNVDLILSHILAFANVALQQDKKALSALCQKVLRECAAFQSECEIKKSNRSNRNLRATSLEHALCQLEDYINEALLRLVFTCFLDFDKFSIEKMRNVFRKMSSDDSIADEIIADFDVNVDRTTQIGIFAIAFSPNLKMRTKFRSCLASFESLDTSLVPALQTTGSELHSELLEQHFNEEVRKFKTALQEIIDSRAFVSCYLEMLTVGIIASEKQFNKSQLQDLAQMSCALIEHFQLPINQKILLKSKQGDYFQQYLQMVRECKAILMCAAQVEPQRIIKRFKILRTVLRKLHDGIATDHLENTFHTTAGASRDNLSVNVGMLEFMGTIPSTSSILYDNSQRRKRVQRPMIGIRNTSTLNNLHGNAAQLNITKTNNHGSVRRRESLRTVLFKRQNMTENPKLYNSICNESASLQISDILDQLTHLSSGLSVIEPRT
ncbi:serendipity locus protein alpha [Scaptodrosophila lebanonensis]|uniref:Serendipity locus protein alpha n=1 Tax=Drosophila lebanonensis TaxID=7225 RepID=A0A6J2UJ17_DROLE|nr:serendipity locus protein alpha [Scaptodrosophila lebanonensis]